MRESFTTRVDAAPALLFARLVDIGRLPEWNHAITEVVEQPSQLTSGAVWKVRLHALGQTWISKSTLIELDEAQLRFCYRSQTDDGNQSYADWDWTVQPDGSGAQVAVAGRAPPTHVLAQISARAHSATCVAERDACVVEGAFGNGVSLRFRAARLIRSAAPRGPSRVQARKRVDGGQS